VHSVVPEQRPGDGAILVMRDGSYRMIIRTGAINFDMKSPIERGGLTFAFGSMVNSLEVDFPLAIISHSKILDIEAYVRQFDARLANERTPPAIRKLIQTHITHFRDQVKNKRLLQRELYVVVPWKGVRDPVKKKVSDEVPFMGLFRAVSRDLETKLTLDHKPTDLDIATARQQLEIRSNQITGRLGNMNIWSRRLNEDDVRKLLYGLYHPALSERQRDPGLDSGGTLLGGFSAEGLPQPQRRISDGGQIGEPEYI